MGNDPDFRIPLPAAAAEILHTLKSHGYEAYIVGGCVRDALLGRKPEDWDITTSALPSEVKSLFYNTADTGIAHGTVMVILRGKGYEVTTYRVDGEYEDSRHPKKVTFTRSLKEDLKRRDFTINAFAWDENGLVDLFDGLSDLRNGIIRCVGDPAERFTEDALRIMRAVRFSAQLCFSIEQNTREMISRYAQKLADISRERIRVEWEKTLLSDHPCMVNDYRKLQLAPYIFPGVSEKCFDAAYDRIFQRLKEICRTSDSLSRLADLLEAGEGWRREILRRLRMAVFFGNLSPEEGDMALRGLKYDNATRKAVVSILRERHLMLPMSRLSIKQALNRMGEDTFFCVLALLRCEEDPKLQTFVLKAAEETADILQCKEPFRISQLAVTGSDLLQAGAPSGKIIGEILENILQKVMQSPTLNRKDLLCSRDFLTEVEYECSRSI